MSLIIKLGKDDQKIKQLGEALGNSKRLEILKHIDGEKSHKDIAELSDIESSSVTYHLIPLVGSGIVTEETGKGLLGRKKKVPKLKFKKIMIEL